MPRNNTPYLAGLAVWVVVFFGIAALTGAVALAVFLGFMLGAAMVFIIHGLFPSSPELDGYRADARLRVKRVQDSVSRIRRQAKSLSADKRPQRDVLEKGCQAILDLVRLTQEKEPGSVASTAARLYNYLVDVERILTQYLEVRENPSYFTDAPRLVELGEAGFTKFRDFALASIRQVNDGQILAYKSALDSIEPLPELK